MAAPSNSALGRDGRPRLPRGLPPIAIGLVLALAIAACEDTGGGSSRSPAAGSGEQGIGRFSDEEDAQQALPAPEVEKGVVPDVIGVAASDAEEAIKKAGFKVEVTGGGIFGLTSDPSLLVCSQDPAGGAEPPKKSRVEIEGQKNC